MAAPAKKTPAPESGRVPEVPARKRELRMLFWREAMHSPWTPVVFFALALLPYIALIELHTPAHLWARPALKLFGLAMFSWVVGLHAWRTASASYRRALRLRHEAREAQHEAAHLLARHQEKLDQKVQKKLAEALESVEALRIRGDLDRLAAETNRLSDLCDKHLAAWAPNRTLSFLIGISKALAIALAIRAALIEPYRIPSGSMIPTLEIGDQIFINKFLYGVRIPWLNRVPFVIVREPARGDVVVFENPVNGLDLVKRIVAVGGDRVEMRGQQLYLNGQPQELRELDPKYLFWDSDEAGWRGRPAVLLEERLDGKPHRVLHLPENPADPAPWPAVVPSGQVLVLGDNRDNSMDSRYGLGERSLGIQFVPLGHIKGKAMIIWLCLGHDGLGARWFGGTGLRTDRFLLPVR